MNRIVYFQDTTTNQSFMDMHYFLKAKGIKNNKFFLAIYDPDLMGVDPYDPTLTLQMKTKIFRECVTNYWYFLREVVRIPVEGGSTRGKRYKMHRGNLAMNYLFIHNYDQFVEFPRQHFKTVSAICWYLWVFNFGSTNTQMMFINMKHESSKANLRKLKDIRSALPDYLQMDSLLDRDGKKIKATNKAETLQHPSNRNTIKTLPAARTKTMADGAGRGLTMALQYYDEFAFMTYNSIIYAAAYPAYSRAKQNAKENGAPYGMLITTTPGDLTTDEGVYANDIRLAATPWNDKYYDLTYQELEDLHKSNVNSSFFYVRYTYKQLGSGQDYFNEMVVGMHKNWVKIRREVLLEWAGGSMNCPFDSESLDIIKSLCRSEPITTYPMGKHQQYQLLIWEQLPIDNMYPPIIGVDVASAAQKDSSAITIVDSKTTRVLATLNCNYITIPDLAQVVFDIVTTMLPNAIVNVERNGVGQGVLQLLIQSKIKKNLFFEIKDRVIEEKFIGNKTIQRKQRVKVYGSDNTKDTRLKLMELLQQRVLNHKDKFISPYIYEELSTMEIKKNGRWEHASNAHDDQVFSYLWALYVWYYGENLLENFHITKTEIKTDNNLDDTQFDLEERYGGLEILDYRDMVIDEEDNITDVSGQLEFLKKSKSISMKQIKEIQLELDRVALQKILSTPYGRAAVVEAYHLDPKNLDDKCIKNMYSDLNDTALSNFYSDYDDDGNSVDNGNLSSIFNNLNL